MSYRLLFILHNYGVFGKTLDHCTA